jgi:hypothetical protein
VSDVNGDTADVLAHEFDLPAVESSADAEAERRDRVHYRSCGADGLAGTVDGGEKAVTQQS